MITPTKESLDAFRPEYEPPHPVPTEEEPRRQEMPRWAKVLAVIAVAGLIAAVAFRLAR